MNQEELSEILEKHEKWLNDEEGGEYADLSGADLGGSDLSETNLRRANLSGSDLRYANLHNADLSGAILRNANIWNADLGGSDLSETNLRRANLGGSDLRYANLHNADLSGAILDYSCWPLWCGSLNAKIDTRIARQLLYHLMRAVKVSDNVDDSFKTALFTDGLIAEANKFHHVEECGKIEL